MRRRTLLFIRALTVLVVLTGAVGILGWSWVAAYQLYMRGVSDMAPPGHEPKPSLEELVRYRRALVFTLDAERLATEKATMEEVRAKLGEPDYKLDLKEHDRSAWVYKGPVFRGHRVETLILDFDLKTTQVTHLGYIQH